MPQESKRRPQEHGLLQRCVNLGIPSNIFAGHIGPTTHSLRTTILQNSFTGRALCSSWGTNRIFTRYSDQRWKILFTNPENISKFKATKSVMQLLAYWGPTYITCHLTKFNPHFDFVLGICTPVIQMNFILQWCRQLIEDFTPRTRGFDPGPVHVRLVVN